MLTDEEEYYISLELKSDHDTVIMDMAVPINLFIGVKKVGDKQ